jgi:hypothetical protein
MSRADAAPNLALLDALRPAARDPAVWTRNLKALAADQPSLAAGLERVTLPKTWRPALALDGFVTWRLEPPDQPPTWLGDSAAPLTRARALLAQFDPHGKNPALPCLGCGAELRVLLERLPPYAAVFVLENELPVLAAVLRTQDYADAIARGRCIFVPPEGAAAAMEQRLSRQPGLLPPGDIVLPNLTAETRITELRRLCEGVLTTIQTRRSAELQELQARVATRTPATLAPPVRLALLGLGPDTATHALARSLQRAAQALGWPVLCRVLDAPDQGYPLVHCQALAEFDPVLTICLNHPRAWLPCAPPGRTCVWVLTESAAAIREPEDSVLYLAVSPLIHAALCKAGVPASAIHDWYWACEATPDDPARDPTDAALVFVADRPAADASAHGITHGTHQLLWTHLRMLAAQNWATPLIREPAKLLVRGERECRTELTDPQLRDWFLGLMERVLIPGVIVEQVARGLADQPLEVLTLGCNWADFDARRFKPLATTWFEWLRRGSTLRPRAWVFAGQVDPLSPALLYAAASGRPVWLHSPGGQPRDTELAGILRSGQHFLPFGDLSDLRRGLAALVKTPAVAQQLADRARRHVTEQHSYSRRLLDLCAHWTASEPSRATPGSK